MITGIILAAGQGNRFGSKIPKQFVSLNGKPVIQYSIDVLEKFCDEIIIVSNIPYKNYTVVPGGETRSESVFNGVQASHGKYIIIHDGVRPFITEDLVGRVVAELKKGALSVSTAVPIVDGYSEQVNGEQIPRVKAGRFLTQTPEGFDALTLKRALTKKSFQDETLMLYEVLNISPVVVEGIYINSKITFESDLGNAEGILKFRQDPITTTPRLKKTLVLGGTGGIGGACVKKLPDCISFGSKDLDLSKEFDLNLSAYEAVIHSAGTFGCCEMEVNFNSCVRLVELAEEQNWQGNIVFISSASATYGRKGYALYSASKAALNAYIESRHNELAEKGIYINAIAPAKTNTPLQKRLNPGVKDEDMIDPDFVADYVLRYTDTNVHGHIIYLRKGFDS